jgi:hypothetical protein
MFLSGVVVASLLALAAPAWSGEIRGGCDIRFFARATLHDFSGTAACLPFSAAPARGPGGSTVISSVELQVPVDGMDTGNAERDAQMRDMFQAGRFPRIRGTVRDIDVKAVREAMAREGRAVLDLLLGIRDVERRIPAAVTALREEGNRVELEVEFPVSLKEFGLKPPRILFIRVRDRVEVRGNVRIEVSS